MKKKTYRLLIQAAAAIFQNGYVAGFFGGTIFKGQTKVLCVPGLNCYSCPGALFSCPIGALQAALGGGTHVSLYVLGLIMLFGVILGRLVCGFLCAFGLIQDLLYKIPTKKFELPKKADKILRYLKYVFLVTTVILMPMFFVNQFGIAPPYFCKYICPAGMLEGGIPLVISNPTLSMMIGFLFWWKVGLMALTLLSSIFIYRPFCKYVCPLGAAYGLFNRFGFFKMRVNKSKCVSCGRCERTCKMRVPVLNNINSTECIRCGDCYRVCPVGAIERGFHLTPDGPVKNDIKI